MSDIDLETIGFDGKYEIIYSESFNVYENELIIPKFLDYKFRFIFENTEPKEDQNDINFIWSSTEATVTLSKKFRNTLGSGTAEKMKILKASDGRDIYFSIFGHNFGKNRLNIAINFYIM